MKRYRKFFIENDEDGLKVVNAAYFKQLASRYEALMLGVGVYLALHKRLQEDALENGDLYINTIKITDGLNRSLNELERHYPFINQEIRNIQRKGHGITIYRC